MRSYTSRFTKHTGSMYLRFHWQGTTYQFSTTPFGLSLVPWLFTKLTRPILRWARNHRIRLSAYLDDWVLIADTHRQAVNHTRKVLEKLQSLGWIINPQKSQVNPTQTIEHLGFSNRYTVDDSPVTRTQDSRHSSQYPSSFKEASTVTTSHPQYHNAHPSRDICSSSGQTVHPTPVAFQEPNSAFITGLGPQTPISTPVSTGTAVVARPFTLVEWQKHLTADTARNYLRGCKQYGLGLLSPTSYGSISDGSWFLDLRRGSYVNQLERIEGSISSFTNLPQSHQQAHFDTNRQHDVNGFHEQTGRYPVSSYDDFSNGLMEMVFTAGYNHSIVSHPRHTQSNSRLRITAILPEKQLDDSPRDSSTNSTVLGTKRCRSLCRPDDSTAGKLRVLAPRSIQYIDRRIHDPVDTIPSSVAESSMEFDQSLSAEASTRTSSTSHHHHSLVVVRHVVNNASVSQYRLLYSS